MLVAKSNIEENIFVFVPRNYVNLVDVWITLPTNGNDKKIEAEISYSGGYAHLKTAYKFKEGSTYPIVVRNSENNEIVFKSQIVCTNQETQKYEQSRD